MPRIPRLVIPGFPHHITQRGVRSQPVFFSDDDRRIYLSLLRKECKKRGVSFWAYCLMTNHVHLIATPDCETGLAKAIGEAHRKYTRFINLRMGVKGYLFQGRFFSCPLDEFHLIAAARYVERNPVRTGIAKQAWDYPWSSARFHSGLKEHDPLLKEKKLVGLVSDWRTLLQSEPVETENLRKRTQTGRPLFR